MKTNPPFHPRPRLGGSSIPRKTDGFTLVEVGIVVLIISVLAALAIPGMRKVQIRARTSAVANDFRVLSAAFQMYSQQNGSYPPAGSPGVIPPAMVGLLKKSNWTAPSPIGGHYTWLVNTRQGGSRYAAVIMIQTSGGSRITTDRSQLLDIDKKTDDGNLFRGNVFLGSGNGLVFVVQH